MAKAKLPGSNQRRYYYSADAADVYGMSASEWKNFAGQYGRSLNYNGADFYDFSGDESIERWLAYRQTLVAQARAAGLSGKRLAAVLAQTMYQRTDLEGADAETFYNDRENHGYQALAEALDASYQDEYNSPVNQVARDRAAGINDSLSGDIAGETPAADAAPAESLPSPGMDPAERQALDLQQLQAGLSVANFGLSVVGSAVGNTLSLLSGLAKISDIVSGIRFRDVQAGALQEQAEGQKIANRDALQRSFLETFKNSIPMPKAGDKFDPVAVMDNFPRGNYSEDELALLDEWTAGGLFFGSDGTPSTALQRSYNSDLAGVADALAAWSRSSALTGGNQDPFSAFEHYWKEYAFYDQQRLKVVTARESLLNSYQEFQNAIAMSESVIAANEARSSGSVADSVIAESDYSQEVYNGMTGFAQRNLENAYRSFQKDFYDYNSEYQNFEKWITDNYISRIKLASEDFSAFSVGKTWLDNSRVGIVMDGYYNVRRQNQTLPLGDMLNMMGRYSPSFERSSGRSISSSTIQSTSEFKGIPLK